MTVGPWQVRITEAARQDFAEILRASRKNFGPAQASAYQALILEAIARLRDGPDTPGDRKHDGIRRGLRSRRIARRGRHSPHMLLFVDVGVETLEVVRILHHRMDIARHLPHP